MKRISTDVEYLNSGKLVIDADGIPFEPASKDYVDQRAPLLTFAGTGSPEGKIAAPVGSIYTDTAATAGAIRWIKTSGTGNTGWRVEYGDTGIRRIQPPALAGGTVNIRRINDLVTLTLDGAAFGDLAGTQNLQGFIPAGFRITTWWPFSTVGVYGPVLHGRTLNGGAIQLFGLKAGDTLRAGITFTATDPWPTSLPGTPA